MPYEEYTPAEAETNKVIKPGIDDNTNGEVDATEFQDMLLELEKESEIVLQSFLEEVNKAPGLKNSLNTAYSAYFKQHIDQTDTAEVGKSFQALVLEGTSPNLDMSAKQLYGLSLLYTKLSESSDFSEFVRVAETAYTKPLRIDADSMLTDEDILSADPLERLPKGSPKDLETELQLPINVFLENIKPEQLRAYITQLTAGGIKLPYSINDLGWLLAYTPERLDALIQTCNTFPFAKITKRDELRDLRNYKDLDEITKKLTIISDLSLQLPTSPNPREYIMNIPSGELQGLIQTIRDCGVQITSFDIIKSLIPLTGEVNLTEVEQKLDIITAFRSENTSNISADLAKLGVLAQQGSLDRILSHEQLLQEYSALFTYPSYTLGDLLYFATYTKDELKEILVVCQEIATTPQNHRKGTTDVRIDIKQFKSFLEDCRLSREPNSQQSIAASLSTRRNILTEQKVDIKRMSDLVWLYSMPTDTLKKHMSDIQAKAKEHGCEKEFLNDFFLQGIDSTKQTEIISFLIDLTQELEPSKKWCGWINAMPIVYFKEFILLLVDDAHKKTGTKIQLEHCNPGPYSVEKIKVLLEDAKGKGIPINFSQISSEYTLVAYLDDIEEQLGLGIYNNTEEASEISAEVMNKEVKWIYEQGSFNFNHYKELFEKTPGAHDLFTFLNLYPQKLEDLGGKIINSISIGDNIHWFRGVLEMLKSRTDIDLPDATENSTEWKVQREKIIAEYKKLIMYKISLDFTSEQGNRIEKGKKTFDKIFFAGAHQNYENAYERNGDIYYKDGEDHNGAFRHVNKLRENLKRYTPDGQLADFSSEYVADEEGKRVIDDTKPKEMKRGLIQYAEKHPDESILVYIGYHGDEKGDAPPFTKQDFIEMANISPRITILSDRCSFGAAYDNELQAKAEENEDYIYNMESPLSGASNKHVGYSMFGATLTDKLAKKNSSRDECGFHEAELYTRMLYDYAFSPLTVNREYTNRKTGVKETKNIGLAAAESVPEMDKSDRISLENAKEGDA